MSTIEERIKLVRDIAAGKRHPSLNQIRELPGLADISSASDAATVPVEEAITKPLGSPDSEIIREPPIPIGDTRRKVKIIKNTSKHARVTEERLPVEGGSAAVVPAGPFGDYPVGPDSTGNFVLSSAYSSGGVAEGEENNNKGLDVDKIETSQLLWTQPIVDAMVGLRGFMYGNGRPVYRDGRLEICSGYYPHSLVPSQKLVCSGVTAYVLALLDTSAGKQDAHLWGIPVFRKLMDDIIQKKEVGHYAVKGRNYTMRLPSLHVRALGEMSDSEAYGLMASSPSDYPWGVYVAEQRIAPRWIYSHVCVFVMCGDGKVRRAAADGRYDGSGVAHGSFSFKAFDGTAKVAYPNRWNIWAVAPITDPSLRASPVEPPRTLTE